MESLKVLAVILVVVATNSYSSASSFRKVSSGKSVEPLLITNYQVRSVSGCALICISRDFCAGFVVTQSTTCKLLHRNNGGNYTLVDDTSSDLYLTTRLFQSRARTIVFLNYNSVDSQYLFFRGGLSAALNHGKISITYADHPNVKSPQRSPEYYSWSQGDNFLDFSDAEKSQGVWQNTIAPGSPGIWTTRNTNNDLHCPLNTFGDAYWMMDVTMNCMDTMTGWFEVMAVVINKDGSGNMKMESIIQQDSVCKGGSDGIATPYVSDKHVAVCGMINVFHFGDGSCEIYHF